VSDGLPEWTAGDLRRFLDGGVPEQTIVRVLEPPGGAVEEAVGGLTFSDDLCLTHESRPEDHTVVYIVARR